MPDSSTDWAARIREWETFFHHFIGYIFHTTDGKRMRMRFLRETLILTLTYILAAVPLMIILWYLRLFSGKSASIDFLVALLIIDLAFGAAFIRTVYNYRNRVRLVYRDELATPAEREQIPVRQTANAAVSSYDAPTGEFPANSANEGSGELDSENAIAADFDSNAPPAGPEGPRVILECNKCHRRTTIPSKALRPQKRCQCGGKIVEK